MAEVTPEKCKQIALARLDLVHKWLEFRKKSQNKLQADHDFVKLHNTSNSNLYEILGKISRGSLHRWYGILNGTEDYGKHNDAIEDYNKAIELEPKNKNIYSFRGNSYYKFGKYKQALADFEEYLKINPNDIEVQYDKKFAEILARK